MNKKLISILSVSGVILGLITGILTIDNRYVKNDDLLAFEKSVNIKLETQRYQSLTDRYYQMRQLQRQYPNDHQLKEDAQAVERERDESKKALDTLMKDNK